MRDERQARRTNPGRRTSTPSGYRVRRAEPSDALALSGLARRAKAHWGYRTEWIAAWTTELTLTPEYLKTSIGLVAESDGIPVGVCVLEAGGTRAELAHMWVAPEHHGHGVGRLLLRMALDDARLQGIQHVRVISDPFAERFYHRLGARRVGAVAAPMPGAAHRTPFRSSCSTSAEKRVVNLLETLYAITGMALITVAYYMIRGHESDMARERFKGAVWVAGVGTVVCVTLYVYLA